MVVTPKTATIIVDSRIAVGVPTAGAYVHGALPQCLIHPSSVAQTSRVVNTATPAMDHNQDAWVHPIVSPDAALQRTGLRTDRTLADLELPGVDA